MTVPVGTPARRGAAPRRTAADGCTGGDRRRCRAQAADLYNDREQLSTGFKWMLNRRAGEWLCASGVAGVPRLRRMVCAGADNRPADARSYRGVERHRIAAPTSFDERLQRQPPRQ